MVLGNEYHRTEHVDRRSTAGVTLQGGGGKKRVLSRKRSGLNMLISSAIRSTPQRRHCCLTRPPVVTTAGGRMEVRYPRHRSWEARQCHGHGRPRTTIGRDIHAVVACESQIDSYIERMYARSETNAASPHPRTLRGTSDGNMKSPSATALAEAPPGSRDRLRRTPGTGSARCR